MSVGYVSFPDNPHWSFTVARLVGLVDYGGANLAEISWAVRQMRDGDQESWYAGWSALASRVEALGESCAQGGNPIGMTDALWRASNYWRMAQFFLTADDLRKPQALERSRRCFEATLPWCDSPVIAVELPYPEAPLPGYHVRPRGSGDPAPAVIYLNGADSLPEETYFTAGRTLARAGYHFLSYAGPGVGLTLYRRGLPTRPDAERFVAPAVDYLQQQPDVDPERIILMGESFAGYLVPRAAAYEPRLAAIVVSSPIYRYRAVYRYGMSGPAFRSHLLKLFGARDRGELAVRAEPFHLGGVLGRVRCPALLLQGSRDPLIPAPVNEALRVYRELGSAQKQLVAFEPGDLGADTHCQKDNLHLMHHHTLNWLAELGLLPRAAQVQR